MSRPPARAAPAPLPRGMRVCGAARRTAVDSAPDVADRNTRLMLHRVLDLAAQALRWFVPRELEEADPEGAVRARMLAVSACVLFALHTAALADYLTLEVRAPATQIAMLVMDAFFVAIP